MLVRRLFIAIRASHFWSFSRLLPGHPTAKLLAIKIVCLYDTNQVLYELAPSLATEYEHSVPLRRLSTAKPTDATISSGQE